MFYIREFGYTRRFLQDLRLGFMEIQNRVGRMK